jgi:hypothetical protein
VVDVDQRHRCAVDGQARQEVGAEDLHVARQDHEVDALAEQQLE